MAGEVNGVLLDPAGDMVVRAHGERGGFEPLTFAWWCGLARPGVTMVDAGAYTGLYAIAAAGRGAEVVAFEPNRVAAARARKNFADNGVAPVLHTVALWNEFASLELSGASPLTSASSVVRHKGQSRIVRGEPLDAFGLNNVAAMKVDVERAEVEVIRGALLTIERDRPVMFVEVLDVEIGLAIDDLLSPLGYRRQPLDKGMCGWRV